MAQYFKCTTDKPALSYKCGEKIVFTIMARRYCVDMECKYIHWKVMGDDGKVKEGLGSCRPGYPLIVEASCERPGYVHLVCTAYTQDATPDTTFDVLDAGAGVDIDQITYHDTVPADFDIYWEKIEQMVADHTPQLLMKEKVTDGVPEDMDCYDVRISTPIDTPASGLLLIPKGKGPFPLRVVYLGYAVVGVKMAAVLGLPAPNTIQLIINAHGFENLKTSIEMAQMYSRLRGYGFDETENASPETTYWRNMMIRDLSAIKFAKTLPEWDGKGLTVKGGSQGALQATTVAAHDHDATWLEIAIPWFCDLNAENNGYMNGWRPKYAEGLRYFDTVAQGMRVKCPVTILARLGDYICPPTTITALYNSIPGVKAIDFYQAGTHAYVPPEIDISPLRYDPENPSGTVKPGVYRHYKGNEYRVIGTAKNSETLETEVLYQALYGEKELWVRPLHMFTEWVNDKGIAKRRFEFVRDYE